MSLKAIFQQEPVAICNAVRLVALAGMTFGLRLTMPQLIASLAALEAVLTLVTRANVHTQGSVDTQVAAIASANQKG